MSCPSGSAKDTCDQRASSGIPAPIDGFPPIPVQPVWTGAPVDLEKEALYRAEREAHAVLDHMQLYEFVVSDNHERRYDLPGGGFILLHEYRHSSSFYEPGDYVAALFDRYGRRVRGLCARANRPGLAISQLLKTFDLETRRVMASVPSAEVGQVYHDRKVDRDYRIISCQYDQVEVQPIPPPMGNLANRKLRWPAFERVSGMMPPRVESEKMMEAWRTRNLVERVRSGQADDRESLEEVLLAGESVPIELLTRFPDLVAKYGI